MKCSNDYQHFQLQLFHARHQRGGFTRKIKLEVFELMIPSQVSKILLINIALLVFNTKKQTIVSYTIIYNLMMKHHFPKVFEAIKVDEDRHVPVKELTPTEIKLKSKAWITPNINKLIRNRNKLFIRKKRQANNQKRNEVNHEIKKSLH